MIATPAIVVDSLDTDPISDLQDTGSDVTRRWVAGARVAAASNRWLPSIGVDVDSAEVRIAPAPLSQIRELVNGAPARIWTYQPGSGTDIRQLTTFAAYRERARDGRAA